jgi:uncharacterized RDD family membrane protein YckC
MNSPRPEAEPASLWIRLLAIVYDLFPLLGLWFAVGVLSYAINGGEPVRPGSLAAWAEFLALLGVSAAYFGLSWRFGGQTLAMRAWRLRAVDDRGGRMRWSAICLRLLVAPVSLAAAGLGFLWALLDAEGRTLHELASRSRTVRLPKQR